MNIFFLDRDPKEAAKFHCDRHVVKMILETAQILSAVHDRYGTHKEGMYKPTHKNHPSTLWAGDSEANYYWLLLLGYALCGEYTRRYGKVHKTEAILLDKLYAPPKNIPKKPFVDPPQCMPDECKAEDTIEAYQNYYRMKKAYMAKWKNTDNPKFMEIL